MGLASLSLMRRLACTFGGGVVLEFFHHWTASEPLPALQTQTTLKTFSNSRLLLLRAVSTTTVSTRGLGLRPHCARPTSQAPMECNASLDPRSQLRVYAAGPVGFLGLNIDIGGGTSTFGFLPTTHDASSMNGTAQRDLSWGRAPIFCTGWQCVHRFLNNLSHRISAFLYFLAAASMWLSVASVESAIFFGSISPAGEVRVTGTLLLEHCQ